MTDAPQSADTEGQEDPAAEGTPQDQESDFAIDRALAMANLATKLQKDDKDKLKKIGCDVVDGFKADENSRRDWMDRNKNYMKLATQVMEKKSWPWDGAANVKYPLLTTASLQFASRAYSSLVPSFDVVKAKVIGNDDNGQMTLMANKLSTHMSYQVMYEIDDWEENMDKLCFVLPIVGSMFKKVYYSNMKKKVCSELLSPKDVIVNYYTKKICYAPRITEIQYYTCNEIKEFQNKDEWITYDEDFSPGIYKDDDSQTATGGSPPPPDDETPRKFLVQYCRIDLDDDGYKEPYIVTVDEESQRVVRIVANFYSDGVEWLDQAKKKVACITPAEWFVKFDFLPNPDGGFYGIGFGILLGGLNDMVNTITNQLIDSGTLSNLQAGFIGRGLRDNKQKKMGFSPGEWKWVNNPGKDLKENIFPLPVREPSATLFNLLGTLVQSGKEVASVAEIFTGKMPGQNTPAATTMASIEQGLKVFTSIYKRIYRGMGKEFELIFQANQRFFPSEVVKFVGELNGKSASYGVSRFDYQSAEVKIIPAADPNMVSETQKLLKIQGLYELVQYGTINTQEMTRQALTFQGQDNITKLMEVPPPPPPIEMQIEQLRQQAMDKDRQLEQMKIMSENQKRQSEMVLNFAKTKQLGDTQGAAMLEMQIEREKANMDMMTQIFQLQLEKEKHAMDIEQQQQQHSMDMKVKATEAQANMAMANQDIRFNDQKNQKQLQQMDSKHELQMKQAKEKQAQSAK